MRKAKKIPNPSHLACSLKRLALFTASRARDGQRRCVTHSESDDARRARLGMRDVGDSWGPLAFFSNVIFAVVLRNSLYTARSLELSAFCLTSK